jgi:hypothetical protein
LAQANVKTLAKAIVDEVNEGYTNPLDYEIILKAMEPFEG